MHIIKITPSENGIYNDFMSEEDIVVPNGWAIIPEDMEKPSTYPRLGGLEVKEISYPYEVEVEKVNEETGEVEIVTETRERLIMTVTKMTEGTLPEPEPYVPTNDELQWQAITDLEIGQMEQDQAITDLEIAQLEGSAE